MGIPPEQFDPFHGKIQTAENATSTIKIFFCFAVLVPVLSTSDLVGEILLNRPMADLPLTNEFKVTLGIIIAAAYLWHKKAKQKKSFFTIFVLSAIWWIVFEINDLTTKKYSLEFFLIHIFVAILIVRHYYRSYQSAKILYGDRENGE